MSLKTAFLISTLVLGFRHATSTIAETVIAATQSIAGIPNDDQPYTFQFKFRATSAGQHTFYIVMSNSIITNDASYHNNSTFPTSYVFTDTNWTKIKLASARTKTLTATVPRKMIASTGNMFYIYNEEYDSTYSTKNSYQRTLRLDVQYPIVWDLSTDGDFTRTTNAYTGATISGGKIYQNPYSITHTTLKSELVNPAKNRLPFAYWNLSAQNYLAKTVIPTFSNAVLKVYDHLEDFSLWSTASDGYKSWVEIPLSLEKVTGSATWRIILKNQMAVTPDGRVMKTIASMNSSDVLTRDLYLPPVSAGETDVYTMELLFEGAGPNGWDTLKHSFTVTKSANYMGSSATSTYCVERS